MLKLFILLLFSIHVFGNERVVALSPAINEIIFALGLGDEIVANTDYCNFPPESKSKPKVGGYFSASLEKIFALKPSIVFMDENDAPLGDKLKKLGIKTVVIKIDSYSSIRESIFQISDYLNKKAEGKTIVNELDKKLFALKGIVSDKKILMVFGHNSDLSKSIFVSGQNLYFDDIISASGNQNALQSKRHGQPILNLEKIIAINPDIIILLAPDAAMLGLSKEALISPWMRVPINATKQKHIYVEDKEYSSTPSQRLGLFLDDMRGFLNHAKRQ